VVPLGGGPAPTGTVYFADGTTVIGSGALGAGGIATMTTSALSATPHVLLAYYAGNGTLAPSLSAPGSVNVYNGAAPSVPGVAVTASPSPSPFGQTTTLTATITAPTGSPEGTVYFLSDEVVIGSGTVSNTGGVFSAQMTTAALSRGVHLLSAIFVGTGPFGVSTSLLPAALSVP